MFSQGGILMGKIVGFIPEPVKKTKKPEEPKETKKPEEPKKE